MKGRGKGEEKGEEKFEIGIELEEAKSKTPQAPQTPEQLCQKARKAREDAHKHPVKKQLNEPLLNQSLAFCNDAIKLDPQYAEAYYRRANVYFDKKIYPMAIADYSLASALAPKTPLKPDSSYYKSHLQMGKAYTQLKSYQAAVDSYEVIADANIDETTVAMQHLLSKTGNFHKKHHTLRRNLGYLATPDVYLKANQFSIEKKYDEAIVCYGDIIQRQPKDAEAYYKRGNVHFNKKEYAEAIADYNYAIGIELPAPTPTIVEAYRQCGLAYAKLAEHEPTQEMVATYQDAALRAYKKGITHGAGLQGSDLASLYLARGRLYYSIYALAMLSPDSGSNVTDEQKHLAHARMLSDYDSALSVAPPYDAKIKQDIFDDLQSKSKDVLYPAIKKITPVEKQISIMQQFLDKDTVFGMRAYEKAKVTLGLGKKPSVLAGRLQGLADDYVKLSQQNMQLINSDPVLADRHAMLTKKIPALQQPGLVSQVGMYGTQQQPSSSSKEKPKETPSPGAPKLH